MGSTEELRSLLRESMVRELSGEALYGSELVGSEDVPAEARDEVLDALLEMRRDEMRHFHALMEVWRSLGGESEPEELRLEALERLRGRSGTDLVEALESSREDERRSVEFYESVVSPEDLPDEVDPDQLMRELGTIARDERRHLRRIEALLERYGPVLEGASLRGPESRLV